ncbi:hypothetical protein RB595_006672 [Gaeumannomyces hyphopodioides]
MLQTITPHHDAHHTRTMSTSLEALTASIGDGKRHLLLAASGSVATIKLPEVIAALAGAHGPGRLSIRVVLTRAAAHFLAGQAAEQPTLSAVAAMPCVDAVYGDADEWGPRPWRRGGDILHIELRRWADLMVIAPLSANTLAKIANGLCDNLLTSVVRAWDTDAAVDGRRKRIVVCPAMNTAMWRHPITARQIRTLEREWGVATATAPAPAAPDGDAEETGGGGAEVDANTNGAAAAAAAAAASQSTTGGDGGGGWFEVMHPQSKVLACGDIGVGGMADWREIVRVIEARLGLGA